MFLLATTFSIVYCTRYKSPAQCNASKGILVQTSESSPCPGKVDQKKPLQSGSSNMYGNTRVNSLTQFNTEIRSTL